MAGEDETAQDELNIHGPGEKLRMAREAMKASIDDIAARTRVPVRLLTALEKGDYKALPGSTYCIGFSRAYARAVGLDEVQISREVRAELEEQDAISGTRYEAFEPADPARVPPRYLAWTAIALALILAVGYGIWRTQFFTAPTDEEIAETARTQVTEAPEPAPVRPAAGSAPVPPPAPVGEVVLTATDTVWLRIYEEGGARLFEKEMAAGEAFTVPATAKNPLILTGRPQALRVTIGGAEVPPLGPPDKTIADVSISATALNARAAPPPPAPAPAPPRP
jgi:cytoskeleton protein RodZ